MAILKSKQQIGQLEKRKGGYFYLQINASAVNKWPQGNKTRLICLLNQSVQFRCGLNHLGDGNYFIILSQANLKAIGKTLGDTISFTLEEDSDPLGVDVPEVLDAVLEQDDALRAKYEALTLGKKRAIIHQISRIKNIDLQITRCIELIRTSDQPRKKRDL